MLKVLFICCCSQKVFLVVSHPFLDSNPFSFLFFSFFFFFFFLSSLLHLFTFTMAKKKSKQGEGINAKLSLAIKSGKYVLGYKSTRKALRSGEAKLVILASNTPTLRKSELEYYALLSKTLVEHYKNDNIALGTAVGRYHRVGVLAITDPGDSDIIMSLAPQ
eukprot:m.4309 g.4309  ORF g.4309 m.4309 type:complete len:162 (+) comp2207_c0_seq1:1338-1823(+)